MLDVQRFPQKLMRSLQLGNLDSFIQKIRKYAEMTELTPYAAHELIKAIYVGAPDKSSENAARASISAMI
jgi:hypothetical protein